jgi:hypothetical protein
LVAATILEVEASEGHLVPAVVTAAVRYQKVGGCQIQAAGTKQTRLAVAASGSSKAIFANALASAIAASITLAIVAAVGTKQVALVARKTASA